MTCKNELWHASSGHSLSQVDIKLATFQFRFVPRGVDAYEDGTPVAVEERLVVGPDGSLESVGITSEVLNENLNLVLPEGSTVNDLDRLVFWCDLYGVSFGRMDVDEKGPTKQFFLGKTTLHSAYYYSPFRITDPCR